MQNILRCFLESWDLKRNTFEYDMHKTDLYFQVKQLKLRKMFIYSNPIFLEFLHLQSGQPWN